MIESKFKTKINNRPHFKTINDHRDYRHNKSKETLSFLFTRYYDKYRCMATNNQTSSITKY